MKYQAVLLCVLALYLHQGEAIRCHNCTTNNNQRCADPFNSTLTVIECPSLYNNGFTFTPTNVTSCLKSVTTEAGRKVVTRKCGDPNAQYCTSLKKNSNISVHFCGECKTDACNGSSWVLPSALLMLVASIPVLMAALKQ